MDRYIYTTDTAHLKWIQWIHNESGKYQLHDRRFSSISQYSLYSSNQSMLSHSSFMSEKLLPSQELINRPVNQFYRYDRSILSWLKIRRDCCMSGSDGREDNPRATEREKERESLCVYRGLWTHPPYKYYWEVRVVTELLASCAASPRLVDGGHAVARWQGMWLKHCSCTCHQD